MGHPAAKNKGFSLVEMMIAIFIIMISMLALATMLTMSMNINVKNELQSAAVRLTNQTAEALLAIPTTPDAAVDPLVSAGTHSRIANDTPQDEKGLPRVEQSIRGFRQKFDINWTVADANPTVKQIQIAVSYTYKNQNFSNTAVVYKHATGM